MYLGNGDVQTRAEALEKCATYGVDGVLIGRASFGNPFIFAENQTSQNIQDIAQVAVEHAQLYEATFAKNENYSFMPMRKHLGWYIRGVEGASAIRQELFKTNSVDEVREVLEREKLFRGSK